MKLVVGLGNPGLKYSKTRHNIGFVVIDEMLRLIGGKAKFNIKFNAEVLCTRLGNEKVILAKPSTFMNLSGEAIVKLQKYYNVDIEDILVVVDDVHLETGKIRIRELGGHGGHNGLRNIVGLLHSEEFKRIRIGVGNNKDVPLDKYVLGKFSSDQEIVMHKAVKKATEVIKLLAQKTPFVDIMTKYNTQA